MRLISLVLRGWPSRRRGVGWTVSEFDGASGGTGSGDLSRSGRFLRGLKQTIADLEATAVR